MAKSIYPKLNYLLNDKESFNNKIAIFFLLYFSEIQDYQKNFVLGSKSMTIDSRSFQTC